MIQKCMVMIIRVPNLTGLGINLNQGVQYNSDYIWIVSNDYIQE